MQPNETVNLLQKLSHKEIAEVFSEGLFCQHCDELLKNRLLDLIGRKMNKLALSRGDSETSDDFSSAIESSLSLPENQSETDVSTGQEKASWTSYSTRFKESPASVNSKHHSITNGGHSSVSSVTNKDEDNERIRISQVGRKKDFYHIERVNEKSINVLQGLELHTRVFNADEQKKIVDFVYSLQHDGQNGQLRERTYSEPRKWMRGKGRVTMQFGCCYNYAVDQNGNPPGIIRDEEVDPLPSLFKQMIKRMVKWQVLPSSCVPNSCIVNIYDEGDCIPPHIDHHDFLRPFCTVSFLTECNILFGTNLKIIGPGEFSGPVSIPLPVGSVLILKGNGADIAKHSIPAVPTKRISITFRKMDDGKLPYKFSPDPELTGIKPLGHSSATNSPVQPIHQLQQNQPKWHNNESGVVNSMGNKLFSVVKDEFPPLGSSSSGNGNRQKNTRIGSRR